MSEMMKSSDAATGFMRNGRVVVVGASLAGLRGAEALRREGFAGQLTLIGDEPYKPYDRPPLSKQVLAGRLPVEHTVLPRFQKLDAEWKLGVAATGLDLASRQVRLADGQQVGFDRLLITTGTRARPWTNPHEAALDGVFVIRDRDDAARLRERLAAGPRHVLIVGGGFIGGEVASVCREMDLPVTLVQRGPTPLYGSLGSTIGALVGGLQVQHGVDLRLGLSVTRLEGDADGHLQRAYLEDGHTLDVDLAVIALGAVQNTEWLLGSGVAIVAHGVACDTYCGVLNEQEEAVEGVFAAGDVTNWPNSYYEDERVTVEHWGNAIEQAETAAHNMLNAPEGYRAYKHMPAFWSNQFGFNIKSVGLPELADEVMITQGSIDEGRLAAVYGHDHRIVAAVTFNAGQWLEGYQRLVEISAPYPPELYASDQPEGAISVAAGFPERRTRTVHESRTTK